MSTVLPSIMVTRRLQLRIALATFANILISKGALRALRRDALRLFSTTVLFALPGPLHWIFVVIGAGLGFYFVGSFLLYNGLTLRLILRDTDRQYPTGSHLKAMYVHQGAPIATAGARSLNYNLSRFDQVRRFAGIIVLNGPGHAFAIVPVELCSPAQLALIKSTIRMRTNWGEPRPTS